MFASVHGREARIDRCAVVDGLVAVVEVGHRWGGRAPRRQDSHLSASTLCLQGQGNGALAKIVGKVANIPVVCGALRTHPILIGAPSSGDHPCGSGDLDT